MRISIQCTFDRPPWFQVCWSRPSWMNHNSPFWSTQLRFWGTRVEWFLGVFDASHLLQNDGCVIIIYMFTKHQYLHTLGKLCVNHCISSTSWGYPRSNYVCLNLHGTGCKNSEPSTIFSCTDFNHRSMSTSPDKSSSLLSGIRNSVGAQCNVVRWPLYIKL